MMTSAAFAASAIGMNPQPGGFRFRPLLLPSCRPTIDVHAGIAQVQRVRMSLAAVADNGDRLALQVAKDRRLFRNIVLPFSDS